MHLGGAQSDAPQLLKQELCLHPGIHEHKLSALPCDGSKNILDGVACHVPRPWNILDCLEDRDTRPRTGRATHDAKPRNLIHIL